MTRRKHSPRMTPCPDPDDCARNFHLTLGSGTFLGDALRVLRPGDPPRLRPATVAPAVTR